MPIVGRIPEGVAAIRRAGEDHGEFRIESDAGLGDRRLLADRLPGCLRLPLGPDPGLALAVIAIAPRLEDEREAKAGDGVADVGQAPNRLLGRDPGAGIPITCFSPPRSWATASDCARADGSREPAADRPEGSRTRRWRRRWRRQFFKRQQSNAARVTSAATLPRRVARAGQDARDSRARRRRCRA